MRGTAILTGPLYAPSGATTRKTALAVSGGVTNLNPPRGPVTPVATILHCGDAAVRATSATRTPAAGLPDWATRPVSTATTPAVTRTRPRST